MTPTLADGILFVGVHKVPGAFLALNAATGALLWSTTLGGGDRSEPVVAGGSVFVGDADGDSPDCHQSGVHAFAETTGAPLWSWYVNSVPNDGGAQWSPISFDGSHLVFGTGNTCLHTPATSNAIVALDTSGNLVWDYNAATPTVDDDIGGGETIVDGYVVALDKNGILYCLSTAGHLAWSKRIGFLGGYGGVATPATDGATIVVSAGYQSDPTMHAIPGGKLEAFDRSGNAKWSVTTEHNIFGAAAISNGVVLSPLDESLVALDLATGKTLWSYAMSSEAYASPAIVPSGIYAVDNSGDIYAFTLPAAGASSSHARVAP
jgi:outer membrane protein assembly factor BamB